LIDASIIRDDRKQRSCLRQHLQQPEKNIREEPGPPTLLPASKDMAERKKES
jgi:hypothetical protein